MKPENAIEVTHLSKVFPLRHARKDKNGNDTHEHWALNDISFEIKKGESVGIIGPNGSGKSTLLQILAGVTKPTSGSVKIKGKVASILDIGAGFHPELSGRENVFLNGQIHGFSKKEIESKFDEIVAFSGIEKFIDEPVKNYSSGMYLRLAFSIMAHLDFDVYLFDEVMSVGDAEFRLKTKEKIEDMANQHKTVVLISHQLSELEDFEKFIEIQSGVLKNNSYNVSSLSSYSENLIEKKNNIIVFEKAALNENFNNLNVYDDLKLLSVEIFQDKQEIIFTSNKSLFVKIFYEKLDNVKTFDLILIIKDINNQIVFTTSSVASGNYNYSKEKGQYYYLVEIPPFFFFQMTYKISLRFIENLRNLLLDNVIKMESEALSLNRFFNDVLYFKIKYNTGKEPIELENFYFQQKIFMGNNWQFGKLGK